MTYDRLVCANCAGPVSEGRCPVCRATENGSSGRGQIFAQLNPVMLVALLIVLIAVGLLLHQVT